jgi:hypothetical protein
MLPTLPTGDNDTTVTASSNVQLINFLLASKYTGSLLTFLGYADTPSNAVLLAGFITMAVSHIWLWYTNNVKAIPIPKVSTITQETPQ